jgi:hypothetical protein
MMVSPAFTTPPTVVTSSRLTTPSSGARSSRRATRSLRPVSCSPSWAARSSASDLSLLVSVRKRARVSERRAWASATAAWMRPMAMRVVSSSPFWLV